MCQYIFHFFKFILIKQLEKLRLSIKLKHTSQINQKRIVKTRDDNT